MTKASLEYKPIVDILEDILGEPRMHNDYKGQISFDCPVCSYEIKELESETDGKGNLEINYKKGVYKCWSCYETHDTHGSILKLIKKYGTPKHLKRYKILKPDDDVETPYVKKYVFLPKEFIPFSKASMGIKLTHHYKQAYRYIKKRNITDDMLIRYNIGFCYDGIYANRIIIPSYGEDGKINYFIARSFLSKTKRKYKNPEAEKELIIWNEHLIDWNKPVYLVEGAFDSIFLPNSIPMLGKFMSEKLFKTVYEKAIKVIIVLDGDAWEDAEKLYHKINCGKLMGKVFAIKLPEDKDIADLEGKIMEYQELQLD